MDDLAILRFIYERLARADRRVSLDQIATAFSCSQKDAGEALDRLAERRMLVLEPNTHAVEMALPFSGVPRPHRVVVGERSYDANCAWDAKEAIRQLEVMEPFSLAGVEQPLAADDLVGMQEVTAAGIVPVVADESVASVDDAKQLVDMAACNIFNIRVSKMGGLSNAARIHRIARDGGLECQLGAQVGESGILSAAGRHYATRSDEVRWYEGSYDSVLLVTAVTEPDITVGRGGQASAISGPGLGVSPIVERLDGCTIERIVLPGEPGE